MRLIIFEIKKLLYSKKLLMATIVMLVLSVGSGAISSYKWSKQVGDVAVYNNQANKYEGNIDSNLEKKIKNTDDMYYINPNLDAKERQEKTFNQKYNNAIDTLRIWDDKEKPNPKEKYTIAYLDNKCKKIKENGHTDSYEYKDLNKNLNMLKAVNKPGYYNNEGWQQVYKFTTSNKGALLILVIIMLAITPIFSEENLYGMDRIILATKMGKEKIVTAKIVAAMSFTVLWVTVFYASTIAVRLLPYKNISSGKIPLNSIKGYEFSPFNWSVSQGIWISYLVAILFACTLAGIFCFISAWQKNTLICIALGLAFVIVPIFAFGKLLILIPSVPLATNYMFSEYTSYNIFNTPILYSTISIIFSLLLLVISIIGTYRIFYKIKN